MLLAAPPFAMSLTDSVPWLTMVAPVYVLLRGRERDGPGAALTKPTAPPLSTICEAMVKRAGAVLLDAERAAAERTGQRAARDRLIEAADRRCDEDGAVDAERVAARDVDVVDSRRRCSAGRRAARAVTVLSNRVRVKPVGCR